MTREEQIEKTWLAFAAQSIYRYDEKSVKDAIKWADEHPNLYNDEKYHTVEVSCLDELYRKSGLYDIFIEKACEWIKNHTHDYQVLCFGSLFTDWDKFIREFRKAMNNI